MRIPWYIYTPLGLLVTLLTLYICVKDNDLVTPPSPEVTAESLSQWRKDNPSLKNTELTITPTKPVDIKAKPAPVALKPKQTKSTPVVEIPEISPALSSLVQQNLTTVQLTSYAEHMLKNHKPQLARIAYERIIDCAKDANEDDRRQSATAIAKLANQTPLWNPDPSTRKKITLNLTINEEYMTDLKPQLEQLQETIFNASDGNVNASIKLTPRPNSAQLCELSIGNSAPIRFRINSKKDVSSRIHAALYFAVRNRSNESQKLISIPELPKDIPSKQALQTYITRLAWVNAAH